MGYTHYSDHLAPLSPANWIEFAEGVNRLFVLVAESGVVLNDWSGEGEGGGKPIANGKEISFNGTGDQSHESFCLTRKKDKDSGGFCKTARKDYDTAVAAILLYLDSIEPDYYEVGSDGTLWNYRDALALAKLAWPQKANMLDFPRSLRDKARYDRVLDRSAVFLVYLGHDGVNYIEDRTSKVRRRLPVNMQDAGFNDWIRQVPNDMRMYGSFSGKEHDTCERKRLTLIWQLSESNPAPTLIYDPMTHGMMYPEITSAHTY